MSRVPATHHCADVPWSGCAKRPSWVRVGGVTRTTAGACIRSGVLTNQLHHNGGANRHDNARSKLAGCCWSGRGRLMQVRHAGRSMASAPACTCKKLWRWSEQQVVAVFGPWLPMDGFAAQDIRQRLPPDPIVNIQSILSTNFALTDDQTLPYDVLDAVRVQHSI